MTPKFLVFRTCLSFQGRSCLNTRGLIDPEGNLPQCRLDSRGTKGVFVMTANKSFPHLATKVPQPTLKPQLCPFQLLQPNILGSMLLRKKSCSGLKASYSRLETQSGKTAKPPAPEPWTDLLMGQLLPCCWKWMAA